MKWSLNDLHRIDPDEAAQARFSLVDDGFRKMAARMMRSLMRHRDRYVKAWIAETGLHPTECELVEERHPMGPDGVMRTVVHVRRRARDARQVFGARQVDVTEEPWPLDAVELKGKGER